MDLKTLASRVCNDLVREVTTRGFDQFIVTTFKYPDGDFISLYLDKNRRETRISDLGTTAYKLRLDHVEANPQREELIDAVCKLYEVDRYDDALSKRVGEDVSRDFLSLCEAIIRVSNLEYEAAHRAMPSLLHQVDRIVRLEVEPRCKVERLWHADFDINESHPVDFRFNSIMPPRHLFAVTSKNKSDQVCAVVHFLQLNGIDVPTMAVVEPRLDLGGDREGRLYTATQNIVIGADSEAISHFALKGIDT